MPNRNFIKEIFMEKPAIFFFQIHKSSVTGVFLKTIKNTIVNRQFFRSIALQPIKMDTERVLILFVYPDFGRHIFGEGLIVPFEGGFVSRDPKEMNENTAETISEGSFDQIHFRKSTLNISCLR